MNRQKLETNPYDRQQMRDEQDKKNDNPLPQNQIPVPPTEDIPAPVKEPFEREKPNEPIIDEEHKGFKILV